MGRLLAALEGLTVVKKEAAPTLKLGGYVRILHTAYPWARIVEVRGPLGPGGVQIYRVRIGLKPKPIYIELREDQLEPVSAQP
jgi:hypothetical protein